MAGGCTNEAAVLEVTSQNGTVLQVFDRFSLGVQDALYPLDDVVAMGQKELEKREMLLKGMKSQTSDDSSGDIGNGSIERIDWPAYAC